MSSGQIYHIKAAEEKGDDDCKLAHPDQPTIPVVEAERRRPVNMFVARPLGKLINRH